MSSLTEWLQSTLINHFYQTDVETNDISAAFSPNAQIFWNHESISVDEYNRRTSIKQLAKGSRIEWREVFEVPDSQVQGNGIVTGYLVARHHSNFKEFRGLSQSLITLSAKIEKDESDDERKIVHLFHTSVDKAVVTM